MKYTIDYGCEIATLYTPHEAESRFYVWEDNIPDDIETQLPYIE